MKVMLAKQYHGRNIKGWWMSEKLDGIRAIWTGSELVSRNGKLFHTPAWFTEKLPHNIILDGELYEGRGMFQQTVGKVRTKNGPDWAGMKYMIFDCIIGEKFEHRQKCIQELILPPHVKIIEQLKCTGSRHLERFMSGIVDGGGEGVMLRRPGSMYEHKRSSALVKYKLFQSAEAVVVGYKKGKGHFANVVGSLVCRIGEKTFKVGAGLSDEIRCTPPVINSVITFSYFERTESGLPRFPVYVGCRNYE